MGYPPRKGYDILDAISTIVPVYLLMALGFLCVRTGYVPGDTVPGLSRFTLRICLPALIFSAVALSGSDQALDMGIALAYLAGSLATLLVGVFVTGVILGTPTSRAWILGLGAGVSNSGFMGYPIAALLIGPDQAARFFAIAVIVENVALLPLGIVAADVSRNAGGAMMAQVRNMGMSALRNPLLLSVIAGLAVRLSDVALPVPVSGAVEMLADVAPAVALFVVGATLARYPIDASEIGSSASTVLGKLFLHPALVLGAVAVMPVEGSDLVGTAVLFAAMPMVSIFPILGEPFGMARLCATCLVGAVTLSFVTIWGWGTLVAV